MYVHVKIDTYKVVNDYVLEDDFVLKVEGGRQRKLEVVPVHLIRIWRGRKSPIYIDFLKSFVSKNAEKCCTQFEILNTAIKVKYFLP
jgi:hypothetical protein